MSTVYLLPDDPAFDVVGFDVTTLEGHEESSTVTENAIEDGSIVTDHIMHAPETFSFEAVVVERGHQVDFYGNADYAQRTVEYPTVGTFGVIIPSALRVTVLEHKEGSRVQEMQDRLTEMRKDGVKFEIITATRPYVDMLIVGVSAPLETGFGGGRKFTVSCRELRTVTTATVTAPAPKEPRGAPTAKKGADTGKTWFDKLGDESVLLNAGTSWFGSGFLK